MNRRGRTVSTPEMLRIQNATDLRRIWRDLVITLQRDLAFAARLSQDPVATLRELGYEVTDEAMAVLLRAAA